MAMIDFIRLVQAAKNFKINPQAEFVEFLDLTQEEVAQHNITPDLVEIFARMKLTFEGMPPESYKVLNLAIGDWVETNLAQLTDQLHNRLKQHFKDNYPGSDSSELDQIEDSAVWTDQLDYMPEVEEGINTMMIDIELVLHGEPID